MAEWPGSHERTDTEDFVDSQIRHRLQRDVPPPQYQQSWEALEELRPRIVAAQRRRQSRQFVATSLAVVVLGAAGIAGLALRGTAEAPTTSPATATESTVLTADDQDVPPTNEPDPAPPADYDVETPDDSTDNENVETPDDSTDSTPDSTLEADDATTSTADTTSEDPDLDDDGDDSQPPDNDDSQPPAAASTKVLESECGKVTVGFTGSAATVTNVKAEDEFTHVINNNGPNRIKVTFRSIEQLEEPEDESVDADGHEICEVGGSVSNGRFLSDSPDEHEDEDND